MAVGQLSFKRSMASRLARSKRVSSFGHVDDVKPENGPMKAERELVAFPTVTKTGNEETAKAENRV